MYIFRGRGVVIDVYKADDKIATSGATSLADIDLRRTYRAIDNVTTGRIPSLFCDVTLTLWFCHDPLIRQTYGFYWLYRFRVVCGSENRFL